MTTAHRARVLAALTALLVVAAAAGQDPVSAAAPAGHGAPTFAGASLNGGGSSFAKLEIDQWRAETARDPYGLTINYVAQGSSFGRQQYIAGNLDFAASDIPFQPSELPGLNGTSRKDFVYVPVSAGGLGFMYNLIDQQGNRVTNLNLTRAAVCRIFTEPNMTWNDPEIQNVNPTVALPNQVIHPIVRSDGSGTSYVLSEFCLTVAPSTWATFINSRKAVDPGLDPEFIAGNPTSNWPQGWGVTTSALAADGVAAAVADSSGLYGITYNEAGFAKVRGFPNASVENGAGQFTQPTEDAVSIALGYAEPRTNGTFQLNYTGTDPAAYFPSTYSYVIAQTTGFPQDKGLSLSKFLCYAVTKGQRVELTQKLGYARLSAPLVKMAQDAIAKIPGAPPWEQCKVESAPPPPAATTTTVVATTVPSGGGPTTTAPRGGATTIPAGGTGTTVVPTGGSTTTSIYVDPVTGSSVVVTAPPAASPGGSSGPSGGSGSSGSGGSSGVGGSSGTGDAAGGDSSGAVVPTGADGTSSCVDPITGLPADPASCVASEAPLADGASPGAAVGAPVAGGPAAGVATAAAVVPSNLPVDQDESGPTTTQIIWWLVQGFSICGVGVALSGAGKRLS